MPAIRRRKGSTFAPPSLRAVTPIPTIPRAPAVPREALIAPLMLEIADSEAAYLITDLMVAAERAEDEARTQANLGRNQAAAKWRQAAATRHSIISRLAQAFAARREGR